MNKERQKGHATDLNRKQGKLREFVLEQGASCRTLLTAFNNHRNGEDPQQRQLKGKTFLVLQIHEDKRHVYANGNTSCPEFLVKKMDSFLCYGPDQEKQVKHHQAPQPIRKQTSYHSIKLFSKKKKKPSKKSCLTVFM